MSEPKIEGEAYTYQPWPCWCHGPDGESAVFASEDEVPEGWSHHGETKGEVPKPPKKAAEESEAPIDL